MGIAFKRVDWQYLPDFQMLVDKILFILLLRYSWFLVLTPRLICSTRLYISFVTKGITFYGLEHVPKLVEASVVSKY